MLPKIRILLYSDHFDIIGDNGPIGLTDLVTFINDKVRGAFDVEFTALNRHLSLVTNQPAQGANRLSFGLLSSFDELWIFGWRQINKPEDDPSKAEPYNELDEGEVAALRKWMDLGGGLMFTGDHSEPNPLSPGQRCAEPGRQSFLTLGRALGKQITRAKDLRVWEGPPTVCVVPPLDNVNTQVEGKCTLGLDALCHQNDEIPQTLLQTSPVHPLFQYMNSNDELVPIEILPDHAHEGKVKVPEKLNEDWPNPTAMPVVAARGFDKRPFDPVRIYDLVVAYDGHSSNIGRIVADSSFHHFVNGNLAKLNRRECCGNSAPDTHLDQIAHYFTNLVIWLAPAPKRETIKLNLIFRLAKHNDVLEARTGPDDELGQAAQSVATAEWGNSNLYQLFGSNSNSPEDLLGTAFFDNNIPESLTNLRSHNVLGAVMREYQNSFSREQVHSPGVLKDDPSAAKVIVDGLQQAFAAHSDVVETRLAAFRTLVSARKSN